MSISTSIGPARAVSQLSDMGAVVQALHGDPRNPEGVGSASGLHPSELRAVLASIAKLRNQLDSLELAAVAKADASGQWGVDGSRSPKAWVERATHCSPTAASAKLRNARVIGDIPELAAVFAAGQTTSEHISALARVACGSDVRRARVGEVDSILARLAPTVRPGKFAIAVANWANRVDAVGMSEDYASRSAGRTYLHVSRTLDGLVAIDGILDPETGAAFIDALGATRTHLRRQSPTADAERTGDTRRTADAEPGTQARTHG